MFNDPSDRSGDTGSAAAPSDVHDIRALTRTGAIPLPGHRPLKKATDRARPER